MKFKKLFSLKKRNSRKPRANAFVLESLEPRLLLSATPMTAAVVTTDHVDYAPGETAVITTSNTNGDGLQFGAGELVRFQVSRTDGMAEYSGSTSGVGPTGNEAWYVTDGIGGFTAHLGSDVSGDGVADWIAPDNDLTVNSSISTTWFVEEQYRNSSLLVTAVGQESGAMVTQAFTDAGTNTTTVLTATAATTVYGTNVDFTATVTAAAGTVDPTGSVEFFVDGISLGIETVSSGGGADGVVQFKTNAFTFTLTSGVHSVHAVFTGTAGSFNDSTSANISHEVTQKHITGRFTADVSKVYDGTTVAPGVATLNNVELIDLGNVGLTGSANFDTANVGVNKVVTFTGGILTGSAAGNYILDSVTGDQADITPATVVVSDYTGVYDGLAHGATIVGAPGEDLSGSLIMTKPTNVGSYTESWTFANPNYNPASGTNSITITKANATIVTSGYHGVYDGAAHTATVTATGVLGESLSGLVLNGTPHSNAGIYSDSWTFTDSTGNYNSTSGSVISSIAKANATISLTGYVGTYDGTAHQATGTATGVLGESLAGLNLSVTSHTNAGAYLDTVTFTDVTGNYKNTVKNVSSSIAKANATISLTGYVGTYDGTARAWPG
ncbi:MAG: Ig-like domain repeat protein [Nitrospirae bacterium]|nr:Ig-like domain repeat protein [Nitrospirota bacterium]